MKRLRNDLAAHVLYRAAAERSVRLPAIRLKDAEI